MNATHLEEPLGTLSSAVPTHNLRILDRSGWPPTLEEYDSSIPVDFVCAWEEEFARAMDDHEVPWLYKPRTFAVEWDDEGNFVDSFTPDFYLPALDLYVQLVVADREAAAKARKVRLLRQQQPQIRIELLNRASPSAIEELFFCLRPSC
jgi:hypothetical protein